MDNNVNCVFLFVESLFTNYSFFFFTCVFLFFGIFLEKKSITRI
jgi:hypothetical protein